jgi:antitoxin component YwqK of YwqJK toxin-antitoxin module
VSREGSGQKRQEGVNKAGLAVGEWQTWYLNGRLADRRTFDDQGRPLTRERWDQDGALTEDKTFVR